MKNYTLDTRLLPEVWVTWLNKNGRIWMDKHGQRYKTPQSWMKYDSERDIGSYYYRSDERIPCGSPRWREQNKIWVTSSTTLYYAYAKYHADIDRLEVAAVKYDTTRGEYEHSWRYVGGRFFIGKDKSIINECGNRIMYPVDVNERYRAWNPTDVLSAIVRLTTAKYFVDEFKKFIGSNYFIIGNGTSVNIENAWHIQKWFESKQKSRSNGKAQKLVDELVKLPLGNIDHLHEQYQPILEDKFYGRTSYTRNIIYFERVNDEWSVLRALVRDDDGEFNEAWRAYIGDDGTNRITSKTDEGWVPASQGKSWYSRNGYYFANGDEAKEKCNRIKYIMPMFTNENKVDELITALRFPCIEQLYKMGQKDIAISVAKSSTPKARMIEVFGYYNEKEKNVLRQVGMTKYQLDTYCEKREGIRYNRLYVIKKLRETLGDDLSRVDNATYDKYLNAFESLSNELYSFSYFDKLTVDKQRFWKNVVRLHEKNHNSARLICDTVSAYFRLNPKPDVDWIFDDYSDVVRTHDALAELQRQQDAERRIYWNASEAERRKKDEEKRKKTDEERKHYEYEDDEYIIRLPNDIQEIISEGITQHICIGSYTSRHSEGVTNLFFLRKKGEDNIPFYAIEMNNDKVIVQIHGFGNKWLGNDIEAIPTVVRWLRKNNIKCDEKILTCKATGYGRVNDYITMPVVD